MPFLSQHKAQIKIFIEKVWKKQKIQVQRRVNEIRNAQDFKLIVSDIWSSLPWHYVQSLYASLQFREYDVFCILRVIYQNTEEFR